MRPLLVVLLVLALLSACEQVPTVTDPERLFVVWEQTEGPYGGDVRCFAVSPGGSAGTNVFVGTTDGFFISTNYGTSWRQIKAGNALSLAVLPNGSGGTNLIIATGHRWGAWTSEVHLSTDHGSTWTEVFIERGRGNVNAFVVSAIPGAPGTNLFAASTNGVYRSSDNGMSWTQASTGLPGTMIQALTASDENLFAGTVVGVFRSTDNGTSWRAINAGLTNHDITSLAVSRAPGGSRTILFAGTSDHVFLSTNNGTSWTSAHAPFSGFRQMVEHGSLLLAGTPDGVFLSTDNGTHWTAVNTGQLNSDVSAIALDTDGTGVTNLFAGTYGDGVFRSTDGGTTWTHASTGLQLMDVASLLVSGPIQPARLGRVDPQTTVLAGGSRGGVHRSTNDGASWARTSAGLPAASVNALALHPDGAAGPILFAGTYAGVYRSTNNGTSWTDVNAGLTNVWVQALAVSPASEGSAAHLIAGTYGSGVFRSSDNGTTWTPAGLTNASVQALAFSPAPDGAGTYLFAGTDGGGIHRSTDKGVSWEPVNSGLINRSVHTLVVVPNRTGEISIFAGTNTIVFVSDDGGSSWRQTSLTRTYVYSLAACSDGTGGTITFAGTAGGVFVSTNSGTNWTAINLSLTVPHVVRALAVSPSVGRSGMYVFAGTTRGLFRGRMQHQ